VSRENWPDLVAGYVLDALEPDELAAFQARLAEDAELRRSVDEARAALLAVAEELPDARPPARLRDRLLERARGDRSGRVASMGPVGGRTTPRAGPTVRRRPYVTAAPWLLLAASVAGLIWLGVDNARLGRESASLGDELAAARASLESAGAALEAAQISLARFDSLAVALTGPDLRFARSTGELAPSLRLFWSPDRALLLVAAENLPPAPAGRTYQLWGIRGAEAPVSLGTFDTEASGAALLTLAASAAEYDASALTEEPAGGSPQPTTQPFLVGAWTAAGA